MEKRNYMDDYLKLLTEATSTTSDRFEKLMTMLEKDKYFANFKAFAKVSSPTVKLNNTAITYNNKVVELYNLYKSKNMDFCDSDLIPVILDYFSKLLNEIEFYLTMLNHLIIKFKKFAITPKVLFKKYTAAHIVSIESFLIKCAAVDKIIFDFSIERDFAGILDEEKDFIKEREAFGDPEHKYPGAVFHNCNIELGLLGYAKEQGERYPLLTAEKKHIYSEELWDLIDEKKEMIQKKYINFPYVCWALKRCVDSFDDLMADAFEISFAEVDAVFMRLKQFDESAEVVDALGNLVVCYEHRIDLKLIRHELLSLNWLSKYDELVQKLEAGEYEDDIEEALDEFGMRISFEMK